MKAILMSIKPQWVAKILNGEKTVEIRKRFPSDYVGWVYIYCTKQSDLFKSYIRMGYCTTRSTADDIKYNGKGKVVARFWCDKVEEIKCIHNNFAIERYITDTMNIGDLMVESCVSFQQFKEYLYYSNGYAIHITKLEIFDKPKEVNEYFKWTDKKIEWYTGLPKCRVMRSLTRAPQSWCYVGV